MYLWGLHCESLDKPMSTILTIPSCAIRTAPGVADWTLCCKLAMLYQSKCWAHLTVLWLQVPMHDLAFARAYGVIEVECY